jgi:hypothetical protein
VVNPLNITIYTWRFTKTAGDRNDIITIAYESFDFVSVISKINLDSDEVPTNVPSIMFLDWRHLIKQWRNQLLNVKRILVLGDRFVQLEHLMKTYEMYKIEYGLWKSDVFVKDKQNVNAALRILQDTVRQCMKDLNSPETTGTRIYLKMGQNMPRAHTEYGLSVRERSRLAWSAVSFLRLWKSWLHISGYNIDSSFISTQTYNDFVLAGHSLILSMKLFSIYFPNKPYHLGCLVQIRARNFFQVCEDFAEDITCVCLT